MKRAITVYILVFCMLFVNFGCQASTTKSPKDSTTSQSATSAELTTTTAEQTTTMVDQTSYREPTKDADGLFGGIKDLPNDPAFRVWPKDYVAADLPVFNKGTLKGWNYLDIYNRGSILIYFEGVQDTDLKEYIQQIEAKGYKLSSNQWIKEPYFLEFHLSKNNVLEIYSVNMSFGIWQPQDLPGIPPIMVGRLVSFSESGSSDVAEVGIVQSDFPKEDLDKWIRSVMSLGFKVEGGSLINDNQVYKVMGGKFRKMTISFTDMGENMWRIRFNYTN